MRYSKALIPTLREAPSDAEVVSHKLMLRAGMILQVSRGSYSYLPLGLRVIKKIERIIREELDKVGCLEVSLPLIAPAELWQESGRWDVYGKELLRVKDRSNREFCVSPTCEEMITDLVRRELRSYKELPKNLYQINTKYRDEVRPRFGLMRGREFLMKDGYSFHTSVEDLDRHYKVMRQAYQNIFDRCGLVSRAVEADTGAIGGYSSHEFMVLADTGEAAIAVCDACEYAANVELAASKRNDRTTAQQHNSTTKFREVHTPGLKTINEVAKFLKVDPSQMIKTLIYLRDDGIVVALIAGNLELNEVKLKNATGAQFLVMADEAAIKTLTGAEVGFAGPIGLPREVTGIGPVTILADESIKNITDGVTGANKTDYHLTGVLAGTDFVPEKYLDLLLVSEGDGCPRCKNGRLKIVRGIEVGQIFKLGTKYSEKMHAVYLDEEGKEKVMVMGTYGIGVGRTAAAAIEQNHDDAGIIWPIAIAPYQIELISVGTDKDVEKTAERIYAEFLAAGVEVLFDDRPQRPGVKFSDADLIGIPYQAIIGTKAVKEKKIELKDRRTGQREMVTAEDVIKRIKAK